jgi:hypothetical protein
VLDTGNFIFMYSGNKINTFGNSFLINSKYIQAIMNFEALNERICSFRIRKFNYFTIISVHAPTEEKGKPVKDPVYNKLDQLQ